MRKNDLKLIIKEFTDRVDQNIHRRQIYLNDFFDIIANFEEIQQIKWLRHCVHYEKCSDCQDNKSCLIHIADASILSVTRPTEPLKTRDLANSLKLMRRAAESVLNLEESASVANISQAS